MKRKFILFVSAFLATLVVCSGVLYFMRWQQQKQQRQAAATAPVQTPTPAPEPIPAPAEPIAPTATPSPAPQPPPPAPEAKEQPARPVVQKPSPKAAPLPPGARSKEHAVALSAAAALQAENPATAVEELVQRGELTPEAAAGLKAWGDAHKVKKVEEIGNSTRPNGDRVTRYRLVAEDGGEDLLLDVVTTRDGKVRIEVVKTTPSDKTQVTPTSDSITVAEGFVESVRRGDMMKARSLVTGTEVTDATVAGLCMIFEEGEFALREKTPIRNAFENDTFAGYVIFIVAKADSGEAEVGMELVKETELGWRVRNVSLDELLLKYEGVASAEGGRYFPIVKNPKGGDSLALFFAFNDAGLTPRSLRQLEIVATLLKQSKEKKLNISGHTDDVGSEKYNLKLSERRAAAVQEALVSFGVLPEQISTEGLGKSQPRRTYSTDDSAQTIDYVRGENRRAEIYLDFE